MRLAIVGGGINGIMCAWLAAKAGHQVSLFERGYLMRETSANSSKLLHGGLRYLAHGEFRLVREALRERGWWLRQAPHLTAPLELLLPVYRGGRPRWFLGAGLSIYGWLAGNELPRHRWYNRQEVLARVPDLSDEHLVGAYGFYDGIMRDDAELGLWAAGKARECGAELVEKTEVEAIGREGGVRLNGDWQRYDQVFNIAGPWARKLLEDSELDSPYDLDLVRGSHVVIAKPCAQAMLLQDPNSPRVLFILPFRGQTLFGTTEQRQKLAEPCVPSEDELAYLARIWVHYFGTPMPQPTGQFAGVRPLIRSHSDPSRATREYALHRQDRLTTVFGGKWTTSRALAEQLINNLH